MPALYSYLEAVRGVQVPLVRRCRQRGIGDQVGRVADEVLDLQDDLQRHIISLLSPAQLGREAFVLCKTTP